MKHELSYHDYLRLCAVSEQKDEKYQKQYFQAIDSLFTNWTSTLGHDKVCVLGFILSRTLKYGKACAAIPFPAFLGGVTSERCAMAITSALKISKNTLRNILKELIEDGFLHAFFPVKRRGIADTFTRYFEIDCRKLQKLRTMGSQIMSILRTPKAKKPAETEEKPVGKLAQPRVSRLPKLGDLNSINELGKPNTVASRRAPPSPTGDFAIKRILRTAPAKAPAATSVPKETSAEIMARITALQTASKQRREEKASSATGVKPSALRQEQVQAVVDRSMTKYYPDLPRLVVTGKAFGAMKNHLKRSAPVDFIDFINWVLRSWSELSQSHARSLRRKEGQGVQTDFSTIPRAPNFAAFGFRLPYFLACYNNRKAEDARMGDKDTRADEALQKAQRAAEQAREETRSARILLRKEQERRKEIERRQLPRVDDSERRAAYDDSRKEINDLPEWE